MLRRIGYRRALPILNLLLYLSLVGAADWDLVQQARLYQDVGASRTTDDRTAWDPVYIDTPDPLPKILAESINFPAVLFALPFGALQRGWRAELLVDSITAFYLLLLWYAVGRWLDRRSTVVSSGRALTLIRKLILWIAGLTIVAIAGLFAIGLVRYPKAWLNLLLALPVLFWPALLAYVARRELRAAKENRAEVTVA
jgi:hypothetical protein